VRCAGGSFVLSREAAPHFNAVALNDRAGCRGSRRSRSGRLPDRRERTTEGMERKQRLGELFFLGEDVLFEPVTLRVLHLEEAAQDGDRHPEHHPAW